MVSSDAWPTAPSTCTEPPSGLAGDRAGHVVDADRTALRVESQRRGRRDRDGEVRPAVAVREVALERGCARRRRRGSMSTVIASRSPSVQPCRCAVTCTRSDSPAFTSILPAKLSTETGSAASTARSRSTVSCLPKGSAGEGRRHRLREAIAERLHALGEPVGPTAEPVFRAPRGASPASSACVRARSSPNTVSNSASSLRSSSSRSRELAFELRELLLRLDRRRPPVVTPARRVRRAHVPAPRVARPGSVGRVLASSTRCSSLLAPVPVSSGCAPGRRRWRPRSAAATAPTRPAG